MRRAYALDYDMEAHIPLSTVQTIENLKARIRHLEKELMEHRADEIRYLKPGTGWVEGEDVV